MKKQRVMAAALALLAFAALAPAAPQGARASAGAQAGAATLEETLKLLAKTLTRHGSRSVGGFIRRFDARDFNGCKISYELTPVIAPDHKGYAPSAERTTIDLSALDPSRVVVREGRGGAVAVSVVTRGGGPGIETRLASEPHHFGNASRGGYHSIVLTKRAAAEEVRAGLVRAIEMCRQQP